MTGSRRGISFFFILSVLFSFSFIYSIVNFSSLIKGKLGFGLRLGLRNWVRVGGVLPYKLDGVVPLGSRKPYPLPD